MKLYIQGKDNTLIPLSIDLSNYYTKDEISALLQSIDLSQYALVSDVEANKIITDTHIADENIHITATEREKWNNSASEEYVNTAIANLVDSAPDTLNTLNELAIAIQESDSIINALDAAIITKANQNDLNNHINNNEIHITAAEREAWNTNAGTGGIQSDWNENDEASNAYIQNRTHYLCENEIFNDVCEYYYEEDSNMQVFPHNLYTSNINFSINANSKYDIIIGNILFSNIMFNNHFFYYYYESEKLNIEIGAGNLDIFIDQVPNDYRVVIIEKNIKQLDEMYIPDTIARVDEIPSKITGTPGQFVVIGDDGNVTTKTIPYAEEASF